MRYRYDVQTGLAKIKTNAKAYVSAGIASLVIVGGLVVPTFAAKPATVPAAAPKATGGIGWSNGGAQAYDEFNAQVTSATCSIATTNVTGDYTLAFNLQGDPTQYVHKASLTQTGSSVGGTGGYPATGTTVYEWLISSGSVTGDQITFTANYTKGADALVPLTTMTVTGTIAPNGVMSGTWNDNYQGSPRNGEWVAASGLATNTPLTGCTGKGSFTYSDPTYNYVMDVKYVNVSGTQTWFAGPTTSGNFGIGTWIFIKVADNGETGIGQDQIWGEAVASETVAKNGVANETNPAGGPFTITSGNLQVH